MTYFRCMACTAQLKGCQLSDRHLPTEMCPPGQGTRGTINPEKANAALQGSAWHPRGSGFAFLLS